MAETAGGAEGAKN